ncbi:hypothetical protein J1N35_014712, partial [Gossypium stocksii]
QEDELNITKGVFDLIKLVVDIAIDVEAAVAIDVEVEFNTDIQLQPFLSESVDKLIHFLASVKEMLTDEVYDFILFLFDNEVKAQVCRSLRDIEMKMLEY